MRTRPLLNVRPRAKTTCCVFRAFCEFQFFTFLWRHVLGVLGFLCVELGLYVLCMVCALYAFSKPYVQHRWLQKCTSG